ncbi:MAG: low-specificity L-threonine aldolase [Anaerolineaceae bacterium 4572_78]|nr:MAG: low-specificity L-threonine aldolase [Anaerolineaceae bacterium 4572_78]
MIDLRSDTVTLPTPTMREAMATALVGDDVYGEDPTINKLQELVAKRVGKEAALFVSSGTQSNLIALLIHCGRGDEYIAGQTAHTYMYEAGGGAVLGSIQPQPILFEKDGTLDLGKVENHVKADDPHFARTRLLCLENTQAGKVLPMSYMVEAGKFAKLHGLSSHLDGARVFNAAVKLKVDVTEITQHVDSVSVCLSKGLSAPVGSVLCGSNQFIKSAHRWRKMLGGGMRQAGILAAAGIIAINDMVERLAEDHANVQTNMVFFSLVPPLQRGGVGSTSTKEMISKFSTFMAEHDIIMDDGYPKKFRAVTHYGIEAVDIEHVVQSVAEFSRQFFTN